MGSAFSDFAGLHAQGLTDLVQVNSLKAALGMACLCFIALHFRLLHGSIGTQFTQQFRVAVE